MAKNTDVDAVVDDDIRDTPPTKDKKTPQKKNISKTDIDSAMVVEAARPSGEVLMESAGSIGRELALKYQAAGEYVVKDLDSMARDSGYTDVKAFLEMIVSYYVDNFGSDDQRKEEIQKIVDQNNTLIQLLDSRNRQAFLSRKLDKYVMTLEEKGLPLKAPNLIAYSTALSALVAPIPSENLLLMNPETL